MSSLSHLYSLVLSFNNITYLPESIGTVTTLEQLMLSNNLLQGTVPSSLANLSHLYTLDLSYNKLNGTFPSIILNMTSLNYLQLQHNELTGTIPESLFLKLRLQTLDLSNNQFSGTLPSTLHSANVIYQFKIKGNHLCDNLYSFCYQFKHFQNPCDVSGFWSCLCSPPCSPSNCQTAYTFNMCLEGFPEIGIYSNGEWIINNTYINLLNFFDISNINGTINGNINSGNSFSIQNSSITVQGNYSQFQSNITLQDSYLFIKETFSLGSGSNIYFQTKNCRIEVHGVVNLESTSFYVDLQFESSPLSLVLLSSNDSIIWDSSKFHLVNPNPSLCSYLSFQNNSKVILLEMNSCSNLRLIGSIVGGVVGGLVIIIAVLGIAIKINKEKKQFDSIRRATRMVK
eukprot:TRINITY_DN6186_c0_g1_i1.p2 TRINITY_DN6186_c0_g1~~TRINITY_DN6186_c0_g1_i1.p2  ORF type:complete len:399 (-),score=71.73 TRINITY_DN6186_c0_g1_i1:65-1261(-)